jgi:hypothetical protein
MYCTTTVSVVRETICNFIPGRSVVTPLRPQWKRERLLTSYCIPLSLRSDSSAAARNVTTRSVPLMNLRRSYCPYVGRIVRGLGRIGFGSPPRDAMIPTTFARGFENNLSFRPSQCTCRDSEGATHQKRCSSHSSLRFHKFTKRALLSARD